jgi:hypothetical protein
MHQRGCVCYPVRPELAGPSGRAINDWFAKERAHRFDVEIDLRASWQNRAAAEVLARKDERLRNEKQP